MSKLLRIKYHFIWLSLGLIADAGSNYSSNWSGVQPTDKIQIRVVGQARVNSLIYQKLSTTRYRNLVRKLDNNMIEAAPGFVLFTLENSVNLLLLSKFQDKIAQGDTFVMVPTKMAIGNHLWQSGSKQVNLFWMSCDCLSDETQICKFGRTDQGDLIPSECHYANCCKSRAGYINSEGLEGFL